MKYRIDQISGISFGTSGARGLVSDMTDQACYLFTLGFLQYARKKEETLPTSIPVAGDLRPSTPRIFKAVAKAIEDFKKSVADCGSVPTPALALYGFTHKTPSIMITGSHIPGERNGLKFFLSSGEILKTDEKSVHRETVEVPENTFDSQGMFLQPVQLKTVTSVEKDVKELYISRYVDASPPQLFQGIRIGLYEHSAVGRDLLHDLYTALGAKVTRLGRSEQFVPIDSEALPQDVLQQVRQWAKHPEDEPHDPLNPRFDFLVSTDADSDRPLLFDEHGQWIRGDILGILTSRFMRADCVCTPITTSSALERCKWFGKVLRTKIGSPYVVEAMHDAVKQGFTRVVGFEPNGGFLTMQPIMVDERAKSPLSALPTRDPATVHLAVICMAKEQGVPISTLLDHLPRRVVMSDRIANYPSLYSQQKLEELILGGREMIALTFGAFGELADYDTTDGLRVTFEEGDIVHLRPSGNAPEFRCYAEADTKQQVQTQLQKTMALVESWRKK